MCDEILEQSLNTNSGIEKPPVPEQDPVLRGAGEEEVVVEGVPGDAVHRGHVGREGRQELGGEVHRAQVDLSLLSKIFTSTRA